MTLFLKIRILRMAYPPDEFPSLPSISVPNSVHSTCQNYRSFPPYALENLAGLHGGSLKLLSKLHNLLDRPSDFMTGIVNLLLLQSLCLPLVSQVSSSPRNISLGSYNQEIHEMTEARAFGMGQYSHNNQPVRIECCERLQTTSAHYLVCNRIN
jgi:hypothetical protein